MKDVLIILLVFTVVLTFWYWRRRYLRLERSLLQQQRENESSQEACRQSVEREQAQQQALLNSMTEGVLVLDSDQRIRLANRALRQLLDVTDDIHGRTILEALRRHELLHLVQQATTQMPDTEMELELPGLPAKVVQVNAALIQNPTGQPRGTVLVFHDLTRLKQLENIRQEFVANISHEWRTPLSIIQGCVETLLDGAKDDPTTGARFLGIIQRHVHRLTLLVEDLLTISHLESGRFILHPQTVPLRAMVELVLEDLSAKAAERNTTLLNQIPAELTVWADPDRLPQVFYNLIENAIKYGRKGGTVIIGAQRTEAQATQIWIQDNGPGIPSDSIDRIFERFYRVDKSRSRDQGGTGLGLAIVKHIVQSHGGKVWARSQLERGATFYFTLPQPA